MTTINSDFVLELLFKHYGSISFPILKKAQKKIYSVLKKNHINSVYVDITTDSISHDVEDYSRDLIRWNPHDDETVELVDKNKPYKSSHPINSAGDPKLEKNLEKLLRQIKFSNLN